MRKPPFLILCLLLLPGWCFAAGPADVAVLFSADIAPYRQAYEGFRETVRQGRQRLRIAEHVMGEEETERLIEGIDRQKPLLVFTLGPEAAKTAGARLRRTPLVLAMVLRPQSLAAPNVTWVSLEIPARTRLERIRKLLPGVRRIGLVFSPESAALYGEIERECRSLGLQAIGRQIPSGKELPEAFAELAPRIDLFFMVPDTRVFFPQSIQYLLAEGLRNGVPVVGLASSYSRAGALLSFEPDYRDLGRQAGEMALRILAGERPARIAPANPQEVRTSLNLAVAERLGIRLAAEAAGEAAEVFQ